MISALLFGFIFVIYFTWGYQLVMGLLAPGPLNAEAIGAGVAFSLLTATFAYIGILFVKHCFAAHLKTQQAYLDMLDKLRNALPAHLQRFIALHPGKAFNVGFCQSGIYVHIADPVDVVSIDFTDLSPSETRDLTDLLVRTKRDSFTWMQRIALARCDIHVAVPAPSNHQILQSIARSRGKPHNAEPLRMLTPAF